MSEALADARTAGRTPVQPAQAGEAKCSARRHEGSSTTLSGDDFSRRLLAWFDRCGRHDLPWQQEPTAYRVWVSEIMLQQTQVGTVIPYFERFVERFPTIEALGAANLDHVLASWSGLGYYARGRNLHRAAGIVVEQFAGALPRSLEQLMALPGIGRSTAGAILALAYGQREPILDGNVKRVLARYHAIEGWPGEREVEREMWRLAERYTPTERVGDYTQAIMDLGATLCVRSRPACTLCPVAEDCSASRQGIQARLPAARPKRERPRRSSAFLVIQDEERRRVLLERRPAHGIWGGLFSLPELLDGDSAEDWCARRLGAGVAAKTALARVEHSFTHFDLAIEPLLLRLDGDCRTVMDAENLLWYSPASPSTIGIAAPINTLLQALQNGEILYLEAAEREAAEHEKEIM